MHEISRFLDIAKSHTTPTDTEKYNPPLHIYSLLHNHKIAAAAAAVNIFNTNS